MDSINEIVLRLGNRIKTDLKLKQVLCMECLLYVGKRDGHTQCVFSDTVDYKLHLLARLHGVTKHETFLEYMSDLGINPVTAVDFIVEYYGDQISFGTNPNYVIAKLRELLKAFGMRLCNHRCFRKIAYIVGVAKCEKPLVGCAQTKYLEHLSLGCRILITQSLTMTTETEKYIYNEPSYLKMLEIRDLITEFFEEPYDGYYENPKDILVAISDTLN